MTTCAPDVKNLYIEIVRGRTKTLYLAFGYWRDNTPSFGLSGNPLPMVDYMPPSWVPTDITNWRFSFAMSKWTSTQLPANWGLALKYDPLVNISDPTTGILTWNIQSVDNAGMQPGNYYFEMTVISDGVNPRTLCSGVAALIDNLNDDITFPPPRDDLMTVIEVECESLVQLEYGKDIDIGNPAPVLSAINPNQAKKNSGDTTITLTGSDFDPNATAVMNATIFLNTVFQDSNTLTAAIPAGFIATATVYRISVMNNDGQMSEVQSFTVYTGNPPPP